MATLDDWFLESSLLTAPAREYLSAAVVLDDAELVARLWESQDDLPAKLGLLWEPYLAFLRSQGVDDSEHWQEFCRWMSETEALIGVGGHPFGDEGGI